MIEEKIIQVLQKEAKPMRTADIAKAVEADKTEVDKAIKKLVKEGKMESPMRCFYDLKK